MDGCWRGCIRDVVLWGVLLMGSVMWWEWGVAAGCGGCDVDDVDGDDDGTLWHV